MVPRRLTRAGLWHALSDESPPFYTCLKRDMLCSELYIHHNNLTQFLLLLSEIQFAVWSIMWAPKYCGLILLEDSPCVWLWPLVKLNSALICEARGFSLGWDTSAPHKVFVSVSIFGSNILYLWMDISHRLVKSDWKMLILCAVDCSLVPELMVKLQITNIQHPVTFSKWKHQHYMVGLRGTSWFCLKLLTTRHHRLFVLGLESWSPW